MEKTLDKETIEIDNKLPVLHFQFRHKKYTGLALCGYKFIYPEGIPWYIEKDLKKCQECLRIKNERNGRS